MLPGPGFRWDRFRVRDASSRSVPSVPSAEGLLSGQGSEGKERRRLGLVGGGLVFFDCCKRNLGRTRSRVPAEDSDGECTHHQENEAGRG